MSELSERLEAAREAKGGVAQGWTNRYIAGLAGISSPTVDRMFNGTGKPKVKNLDAVAAVLGVPIHEARRLTGRQSGEPSRYEGPAESQLLNVRQRNALDELIRSIVAARPAARQDGEDWSSGWGGPGDEDPGVGGDQEGEHRDQL